MRMKRALIALLAAVALVALTGCFDVEQHLTVNADGSADIANTITVDASVLDSAGEDVSGVFDDISSEAETDGFKVEDVDEGGKKGIKATKHIDDIADLDLSELGEGTAGEIKVEKSFLQTKVTVDLSIPFDASAAGEDVATDPATADLIEANFKLTLPGKIDAEGADEITDGGKTATWKLTSGEEVEIKATSSSYNMLVLGGIGGGALLLVIVIVVIVVMMSRKKKAAAAAAMGGPMGAPQAGYAPAPMPQPAPMPEPMPAPMPQPAPMPEPMPAPMPEPPAPAPEAPATKFCSQCGTPNEASAAQCSNCGATFG